MQLQVKMHEKKRNNVFASKQTTNKALSNIFRGFEVGTKVRLMLSRPNHKTQDLWNICSR